MIVSSGEIKDFAVCAFSLALLEADRNTNPSNYVYIDSETTELLKSVEGVLRAFVDNIYADVDIKKRVCIKLPKMMGILVEAKANENGFLNGYVQTALQLLYLNLAENERGDRKLSERLIELRSWIIDEVKRLIYASSDHEVFSNQDYDCEQSAYQILSFARSC